MTGREHPASPARDPRREHPSRTSAPGVSRAEAPVSVPAGGGSALQRAIGNRATVGLLAGRGVSQVHRRFLDAPSPRASWLSATSTWGNDEKANAVATALGALVKAADKKASLQGIEVTLKAWLGSPALTEGRKSVVNTLLGEVQSQIAGPAVPAPVVAQAGPPPATLLQSLKALQTSGGLTLGASQGLADSAPQDQRDAVYADKTFIGQVETTIGVRDYIKFLGALRVVELPVSGTLSEGAAPRHTSAAEADALIQEKMGLYVAKAVKEGKQVSGQVAVLNQADFVKAYTDENGYPPNGVNAFVRVNAGDRLIVVNANKGNAGTVIHEGMHKYSDLTIKSRYGQNMNEAFTEYMTRLITDNLPTPIVRGNYADNFEVGKKLAALLGPHVMKSAYFNGKVDELIAVYKTKTKRGDSDWNAFTAHVASKEWDEAEDLIEVKK